MKRDDSEIIEVFETDDALFANVPDASDIAHGRQANDRQAGDPQSGDPQSGDPVERASRRPRWVVPGGVAAVLAVVAVVATTGADERGVATQTVATPTVASTPVTLAALPSTSVDQSGANDDSGLQVMPRYSVPLSAEFSLVFASSGEQIQSEVRSQLWASPGASRQVGRWVAISAQPPLPDDESRQLSLEANAYPVQVGDSPGLVTPPSTAGEPTLLALFRSDSTVYLEGFGVTTEFLLAEAGSVTVGPAPSLELTHSLGIFDDFRLIVDAPRYWRTIGRDGLQSQAYFRDQTVVGGWNRRPSISVRTTRPNEQYIDVLPFLLDSLTPFPAPDGSIGFAGAAGPLPGESADRRYATAYWVDRDGWAVSVTAPGTISEVASLAQTAYRTEPDEWAGFESGGVVLDGVAPTVVQAKPIMLDPGDAQAGDGNATAGLTVRARLQSWTLGEETRYSWAVELGATDIFRGDTATVQVLSTTERAYVFATVPRDAADGVVLTVSFADGTTTSTPLQDIEPAFDVFGATVNVDRIGAFTAVIATADGTVLAAWPTLAAG